MTLVGQRCSGKSSVGRLLAERLGRPFLDADVLLAERWSRDLEERPRPAGELLQRFGLAEFREREAALLRELLEAGGEVVIATGGGAVEDPSTRERLASASFCLWLRADPELLLRRARGDRVLRPALTDVGDPLLEMRAVAVRREPWYQAASHAVLDTDRDEPAELARRAEELCREAGETL